MALSEVCPPTHELEIRGMLTSDKVLTPAAEALTAQAPVKRSPTARVLIVDDEPAACKLLALLLSEADFECKTALGGAEALRLLEKENRDAIVCDLNMPGMTGMEVLAEVRRRWPQVAFLVATGLDDVRAGVLAMKSGADDYLVKPLHADLVIASLHRALQKKRLEQEVEGYRLHLEEMVAERTKQIEAALKLVERSYEDTLEALGAAIDLRDAATEGHSRRVCRFALEIAKAMGLSEGQHKTIAMGAYLHDIGKLALPDGILLKPGPLTAGERVFMQQHVQTGYDLVKQIPFLADAAELIRTHHERYDGSGYLRGLKAEQIPIGARIFAVADSLDAITSDRPYRKALPFEDGFRVIHTESGRLYDPQVTAAFFSLPKESWSTIARMQHHVTSLPSWLRSGGAAGPLGSP
jgi:putative nucleotidyltransferase with HDIG domain